MLARPSLSEIHSVLAAHNALIVHFSGTPKGAGSDFEYLFPFDLEEVVARRCLTGISCSTVMPDDEFRDPSSANATGCIGVIVSPLTPSSILDACPTDCGTYMEGGIRQVSNARDMTSLDFQAAISKRPNGSYNEWVIADYEVIGLFVAEPYRVSEQVKIDYPDDMPDYLRANDTDSSFECKSLDEIEKLFPNLLIYSFSSGGVVQRSGSDWVSVAHSTLYPIS